MIHPYLFLSTFIRSLLVPLGLTPEVADTIAYTWLIMLLLVVVALLTRRAMTKVPGKLQNFVEVVVGTMDNLITDIMGPKGKPYFPLIATLALFILVSNLTGLLPGFFPPTADINTTAACALIVFLATHVIGIKKQGFAYLKHFFGPIWWLAPIMLPIELIGHLSRPMSLTLRLFGNMRGHELVLMVFFTLAGAYLAPLPMMAMGILVSFIQSFVFMLLTMLYLQGSLEEHH
jgi:F-type H+-transporting ATPase subunit a